MERRLIRRIVQAQREAMTLRLEPVMACLDIALIASERAAADRTPDPTS
ncbi:hypothetical protein [Aureimonas flava]|nr:hypothetical protein [Aureimonas flava]